jgi:hypothetical protein
MLLVIILRGFMKKLFLILSLLIPTLGFAAEENVVESSFHWYGRMGLNMLTAGYYQQSLNNQLMDAIDQDNQERVRELLQSGANSNYSRRINLEGGLFIGIETPLQKAVGNRNINIVQMLQRAGANADLAAFPGLMGSIAPMDMQAGVFEAAVVGGNQDIIAAVEHVADPHQKTRALIDCIRNNNESSALYFINSELDVKKPVRMERGRDDLPLIVASENKRSAILQALLGRYSLDSERDRGQMEAALERARQIEENDEVVGALETKLELALPPK